MKQVVYFLVLCVSVLAYSQSKMATVKGNVTINNIESVIGASVIIKSSNFQRQSSTDENGNYIFNDVPFDTYTLEASSLSSPKQSVNLLVNSSTIVKNFTFENSQSHLISEVKINVETEKSKILNRGYAVDVIETKEAGLRNLQTNELLDRTVGVRIRQNGGLGSDVNYNINGMSGNSVRIFVDGIPISTYGSSFDLNSIPPAMIDRIEVYKGVVPGYLSDDALGGAINVVMKKGFRNNLNISSSYGSFNTSQLNFSGLYRFEKSGFTIKASGFYNKSDNDYEVWGNNVYNILPNGRKEYIRAKRFNDAFWSKGGVIEAGFTEVKWADNFFVGFTGSDSYKEVQHGTFMTTPYKGRFVESDAKMLTLTYNKKNFLVNNLDFNFHGIIGERNRIVNDTVKWNYNWNGELARDLYGNPISRPQGAQQGAPTLANINRKTASIRSGISYSITDNHKFILNYMYQGIDREDDDLMRTVLQRKFLGTRDLSKHITSLSYELTAFDNKLKTTLFGKNYQQEIERINPVVNNVNGEQVIQNDVAASTKKENGYGFAASYQLLPTVTVMASAEKAIRLPNENEIFGDAGDNVSENTGINPESSQNYNLGVRLGTFKLRSHEFTLSANGFLRDIKDRIGTQVQTQLNINIQTLPYANQGNAKSKGFDVEFGYTYNENFNFTINASKFRLTYKNMFAEKDIPNEPNFTVNAGAQYSFKNIFSKNSRLNLFYNLLFVDKFNYLLEPYGNNAGTDFFNIQEQFIQDAGISYVFPKKDFVVSFDVKNIFDKQAFDNFAVQKPGRAFYIKLNYILNNF